MDGKLTLRIENLISDFNLQNKLCTIAISLTDITDDPYEKKKWIPTAWEVYEKMNTIIKKHSYPIMAVLNFPLKPSDHQMAAPTRLSNYVIYHRYAADSGIILTRISSEEYLIENKCIELKYVQDEHTDCKFYYSQYWSHGMFRRFIDILPSEPFIGNFTGTRKYTLLDPKMAYLLEGEIMKYAQDPDYQYLQEMDYILPYVQRKNWIEAAWDMFHIVEDIITQNNFAFRCILNFQLKQRYYTTPRHIPKELSLNVLNNATPPCFTLSEQSIEEIASEMDLTIFPLPKLSDSLTPYKYVYCKDEEKFSRKYNEYYADNIFVIYEK